MSGHTPGPWGVVPDDGHPANARITSIHRRHVAKVYAESTQLDAVCEANARLIAAAPELLEALKDALCALECCGKDYPAATKARAAIDKATGAAE